MRGHTGIGLFNCHSNFLLDGYVLPVDSVDACSYRVSKAGNNFSSGKKGIP
jgi:hypothetical protein